MRTAIYVYGNRVSFELRDDIERIIQFVNPDRDAVLQVVDGAVTLDKGVYKLVTDEPAEIRVASGEVGDADVVVVTNNKDPWPDPPAKFSKTFSEVAPASLQRFFPTSGGVGSASRKSSKTTTKPKAGRAGKPGAKRASR